MTVSIKVVLTGPVFAGAPARLQKALGDAVRQIVDESETDVKAQLYPGHGLVIGHYRRSIHGEMRGSTNGFVHDSNVVYGPWLEGTSSRNRTTRFKGYRMFRKTAQKMQRRAPAIIREAVGRAF